jgi:hypothetical protein
VKAAVTIGSGPGLAAKLQPESQKLPWRRGGPAVRLEQESAGRREGGKDERGKGESAFLVRETEQEMFPWEASVKLDRLASRLAAGPP